MVLSALRLFVKLKYDIARMDDNDVGAARIDDDGIGWMVMLLVSVVVVVA